MDFMEYNSCTLYSFSYIFLNFRTVPLEDMSLEQVMGELSLDTHLKVEENTFVNVVEQVIKELKVKR